MKNSMVIIDSSEFTVGWKKSGIIFRFRGMMKGLIILIRDVEFSLTHYSGTKLSWSWILRIPGMKTRTW